MVIKCVKNNLNGELPLEEIVLEQAVLLLGRAFQSTTYHRRFNALSSVMVNRKN